VLVDNIEQRLAHLLIVERRLQEVEPHHADRAERVASLDADVSVLSQQWDEIGRRLLPPIGLARAASVAKSVSYTM
jgi:hypothetical protein